MNEKISKKFTKISEFFCKKNEIEMITIDNVSNRKINWFGLIKLSSPNQYVYVINALIL